MYQFILHFICVVCIFLFVVLGYNFVFGKGKILHFGQAGQSLVAAYGMWILIMQFDWSFWPALVAAAALSAAFSLVLAMLSFRLEPDGLGVMTIALHLSLYAVVLNWHDVTRGPLGLTGIQRAPLPYDPLWFTIILVACTIVWIFFLKKLNSSFIGRSLDALAENEWHAESLGISRKKVHTIAFLVSGTGSFINNIFYAPLIFLLTPADFYFPTMVFYVMCVSAGGPGRIGGVVLGSTLIILLREGLRFINLPVEILGPTRLILFGLILFIAVWLRRDTLFPKQRSI